jgi:phosphoribosylglycinamide formyltransferase 1
MPTPSLISLPAIPAVSGALVKLGILASGSGTNLEAIAEAIDRGELNAEIAVVLYNRADAGVAERARRRNLLAVFVDHGLFESRRAFDEAIVGHLQAAGVEWVIMAGWMRLVTSTLLDAYEERVLNIHPSLLPSFPGLRAVEQALEAGVKIAGCTVHVVTCEMDAGPIIAQAAVPVLDGDTAQSLHRRIQVEEHRLYPRAIALAASQAPEAGDRNG